jgi:hypothetical protein
MLPEAPLNEQGILVSLRSLGLCQVRIESPAEEAGRPLEKTLRVSEPWRLRVRGPFTLTLGDAGMVTVEVAGRRIPHGQSVGESWTGRFDGEGRWLKPEEPRLPQGAPLRDDDEEGPRP